MSSATVLVVTGLAFEADIARRCPGVEVWCGVGAAALHDRADAVAARFAGIVSFGTAGGLDPMLQPGDCILAEAVYDVPLEQHHAPISPSRPHYRETDPHWLEALSAVLPDARRAILWGASNPVVSATDKARLFLNSGAAAVDMESHLLSRLANRLGLPFAACRVIIDRATHTLPDAALAGMSDDGQTHLLPVLRSLARRPSQLPSLLRLGKDAAQAKRALARIGEQMPAGFALTVPRSRIG